MIDLELSSASMETLEKLSTVLDHDSYEETVEHALAFLQKATMVMGESRTIHLFGDQEEDKVETCPDCGRESTRKLKTPSITHKLDF